MNIMGNSIQDYLKKINSRLTWTDCVSIFITCFFLVVFLGYLYIQKEEESIPVTYKAYNIDRNSDNDEQGVRNIRPFASKHGKTYTFSWCSGSSMISEKNKLYFDTEEEAKKSGRTLSKLCEK